MLKIFIVCLTTIRIVVRIFQKGWTLLFYGSDRFQISGKFVNNLEVLKWLFKKTLKNHCNLNFFVLLDFLKMCLRISVRHLMDLSVSTLSGRIANNPGNKSGKIIWKDSQKSLKLLIENFPKWLDFIKFILWIFRKYCIFPKNTTVLGPSRCFQPIKEFPDFLKISDEFSTLINTPIIREE